MTKIAVLVGSIRNDSLNQKFAHAIEQLMPEDITFEYAAVATLPLFNQERETSLPDEAKALKNLIESSDGVFIVTPEYNRGYPGVLKNAIDWASRPWGTNSFDGKKAVLAGVSGGALGTTQAQSQLRNVLLYLNTRLMGQPEAYINGSSFFAADGSVAEDAKAFATEFADALVAHMRAA